MDDFKHHFYQKLLDLRLPKDSPMSKYSQWWRDNYPLPIEGCTQEEIEMLKQAQQVTILPTIYEAFLKVAGKSSGDIFIGYDIDFYYLKNLKNFLMKMMQEDKSTRALPPECFVFLSQQGHTFWYFSALEDSYDPPVYMYSEGREEDDYDEEMVVYLRDENPEPIFAHLSEFLTLFIAERESKEAQEAFLRDYVRRK